MEMRLPDARRSVKLARFRARQAWSLARGALDYNLRSRFTTVAPREMIINLTYRCDSRCMMCDIWKVRPTDEMSLEQWRRVLSDPLFRGMEGLTIAGGEPTMHPDFVVLAGRFLEAMPRLLTLAVITNGFEPETIVPKLEAVAALCQQKGVRFAVSVSIDGLAETHARIRRVPDAFERSMKTVLELRAIAPRYGMWVGCGSMLMRQNLEQVEAAEAWFKARGIPLSFQILHFNSSFFRNTKSRSRVDFLPEQRDRLIDVLDRLSRGHGWRDWRAYYWQDLLHMYRDGRPRTAPCPFQTDELCLDSFGDVYFCLSEPAIGNCRADGRVSAIYYSRQSRARRQRMTRTVCPSCNSGCQASYGITKDVKRFAWFKATGRPWYGVRDAVGHALGWTGA